MLKQRNSYRVSRSEQQQQQQENQYAFRDGGGRGDDDACGGAVEPVLQSGGRRRWFTGVRVRVCAYCCTLKYNWKSAQDAASLAAGSRPGWRELAARRSSWSCSTAGNPSIFLYALVGTLRYVPQDYVRYIQSDHRDFENIRRTKRPSGVRLRSEPNRFFLFFFTTVRDDVFTITSKRFTDFMGARMIPRSL